MRLNRVVGLAGCYSSRSAPLASVEPQHQVRVTTWDGHAVELFGVTVSGDTLRGLAVRLRSLRFSRDMVAMPVAGIAVLEVRRLDVGRSVAAGVGMAAVIARPVLIVILLSKSDFDPLGGMRS
jgi:hypothetical protein